MRQLHYRHGGIHCDFIDEDAAMNATVLSAYDVLFVTEPNVPMEAIRRLGSWVYVAAPAPAPNPNLLFKAPLSDTYSPRKVAHFPI
jgi:hypothetical protein